MFYSKDFKDRVIKAFPGDTELEELLDRGDTIVGRILDDSSYGSLPLDVILEADSLEKLQAMARIAKEKKDLYAEWCEIYRAQMVPH